MPFYRKWIIVNDFVIGVVVRLSADSAIDSATWRDTTAHSQHNWTSTVITLHPSSLSAPSPSPSNCLGGNLRWKVALIVEVVWDCCALVSLYHCSLSIFYIKVIERSHSLAFHKVTNVFHYLEGWPLYMINLIQKEGTNIIAVGTGKYVTFFFLITPLFRL